MTPMFEHDERRDELIDTWDAAATAWGRQADRTLQTSQPVIDWMIEASGLEPGQTVLELAAGPGDTGFAAARRIAPHGKLICSDASGGMLEVARDRAEELEIRNVEFKQLQLEWIDLDTASVDRVLIKWGLMLVLDPEAGARECRRVLKPGGRLVLAVWDLPETNPWTVLPQQALRELGHLPVAQAGGPGMFALADREQLQLLLQETGFFDAQIEPISLPRTYPSLTAWLGEVIDLSSSVRAAWNPLDDEQRRAVRERLAELAGSAISADGSVTVGGSCLGAVAEA